MLTAARTNEVLGAHWEKFDLDAGLWEIPASRMKGKRRHLVPLSNRARQIVEHAKDGYAALSDYVFPGNVRTKPMSNMAFLTMRRMKLDAVPARVPLEFQELGVETNQSPA
jgi:integrase